MTRPQPHGHTGGLSESVSGGGDEASEADETLSTSAGRTNASAFE
jgi:hypothetical protein